MYCTHCGHDNPAAANFCANCGRPLVASSAATTGAIPRIEPDPATDHRIDAAGILAELSAGTALLIVVRGPNEGARYLIDRAHVTAGRHPDSEIFLDDITVSRRHVHLRWDDEGLSLEDAGSLNGTYVNMQRVERTRIGTGDEIQIGKFKLLAIVAEPAA